MAATVYEALVQLFTDKSWDAQFKNGLITGTEPPGTDFPYAIMDPTSRAKSAATNRTNYWRPNVSITVYDKTFEAVDAAAMMLAAGLEDAPLPMDPGEVNLFCTPVNIHQQQEDTYWKATVDVEITTAMPRVRQ